MTVVDNTESHGVRPRGERLAFEFEWAGSVCYILGSISGGPGDKWAVVRMVGAWYR